MPKSLNASTESFIETFVNYTKTLEKYKSSHLEFHKNLLTEIYETLSEESTESIVPSEMKTIKFSRVTLKNFGNVGDLQLQLSDKKLFAAIGTVGAGKTTIFDAIYFAMTGISHKYGAQNSQCLIKENESEAIVTLELKLNGEDVIITRTIPKGKQNKCQVEYNGKKIGGIRNTQKLLEKLFPLTPEQLAYMMFLKQGGIAGIFDLGNRGLQSIIVSNILNLDLYRNIFDALSPRLVAARKKANELMGQETEAQHRLDAAVQKAGHSIESIKLEKDRLNLEISNEKAHVEHLNSSLEVEQSLLAKEQEKLGNRLVATIRQEAVHEGTSTCPVCESSIGNKLEALVHAQAQTLENIESIETRISNIQSDIEASKAKSKELKDTLKKSEDQNDNLVTLKERLMDIKRQQSQHSSTLDALTNLRNHFFTGGPCIQKYLTGQLMTSFCNESAKWIGKLSGKQTTVAYSPELQFSFTVDGKSSRIQKSYSGGEQTIFALGLLLTAREFLSKRANIALGALFIDEGFHTFNSDVSLQRLMDALTDNHIHCGIITHNAQLANQFPNILSVTNGTASWTQKAE